MTILLSVRSSAIKIVSQLAKQSRFQCILTTSSSSHIECYKYYSTNDRNDQKYIVRSPHNDVATVVGVSIPEFIWSNLGKWENLPAFECAITKKVYTHGQVYKYSRGLATALLKSGLKQGDVVGVLLLNSPEYPIVMMGIFDAGLVASPANPNYTADELVNQMNDCEAKCLVTSDHFVQHAQKVKSSSKTLKSIIVVADGNEGVPEGTHSFSEMIKVNSTGMDFLKGSQVDTTNTIAVIPYSSGTTGPPKGVVLTHSNFTTNLLQQLSPTVTSLMSYEDTHEQDRLIGVLPFFHIFGLNVVLSSTLFKGCHNLTMPKFEPRTFIQGFRNHKPTVVHLVTPLINFMVNSKEFTKEEFSSLRTIMGGAAPVGPNLINSLLRKAEKYIFFQEGYGMTEMSPVSHMLPPSSKNKKLGSCGQVVASTVAKIINVDTKEALGPNQSGELCVKGNQVMKGYFKNEKATQETIDSDMFLHTGDIAYYDEEGYFYIVDRLKELIKVKGLQVAPAELEDVLRKIPEVGDCAVVGIPSESSGELPRAYIVKKDQSLTADAVHAVLKDKVAKHKQLNGGIEFVDSIPRAQSGKILRRELKASYLTRHDKKSTK